MNKTIVLDLKNYYSKTVRYTVLKNGSSYISGTVKGRDLYYNQSISVPSGDYSVRVYCGVNTTTTGCLAGATIKGK